MNREKPSAAIVPLHNFDGRRNCLALGVCQAYEPRCNDCEYGDCDEQLTPFDHVSMWIASVITLVCTVGVVVGLISFLLHHYGWLTQ